ncbi:5'-nucleotidase C-terminal domain-containing protein [Kocuria palustris]|jgi:2',3'-cyclic-nucleotide 2'-phosphodiesterase (5'-nucleotidase family)|uniref:bifunctional metallophosphatase/5'-nucleotidase n=1 Tax=Kocuria palustris TaxID=71999 RepID=UPI0019D142F8|nr:5'-nucleotidase C-terminal domain-containing protein [Kocuria palustris]MBN6753927.1 5'-nucleotidase C-terminal domain-containing protein [Kocuria palustris]MBN6758795.1 5'-nucleotidase C-terminal domain-containing protein [Kocuria palustris]MBN6764052.1 5'-nucleotidase C-terminal domain-containing protein [Kocuria palustris]MBN6783401.1 5'-nucleotidase C-terminal domain-containing protein [Kocuria palustris]MBN6800019.1 5'-nucleotidase C-terminal domain-containing protein [Kocuria palustri
MSALKPSHASSLSAAVVAGVVVTSSFVVPAQAVEPTPDAASATATTDLLYFNDFHGRLDEDPVGFAGAIESQRGPEDLLLSGGDNIGASQYTSAAQDDNPTLDMLNALELDASAVGNHEFDQGRDDLTERVVDRAEFPYLAANVRVGSETGPLLMEGEGHDGNGAYELFERDGVSFAVIGAVTQATPSKLAPSATEGLVFTDPVAEVNAVAEDLAASGEADVIIAAYHDGSASQTQAESDRFWTETSEEVDVIFGGDTHAEYTVSDDVDGDGTDDRAYMQTGSYMANLGKVEVTYDAEADDVDLVPTLTSYDEFIAGQTPEQLVASSPRTAEVDRIVDEATATAEQIGSTPAGQITGDLTTAFTGTTRDDRQNESALGNAVAEGFRSELAESHGVDIGVINPGGLRNELYYVDDPEEIIDGDADGVVTEAEINNVLPFANNLNTVELTGAQFEKALEQQWQPEGSSRAFLHLGLSDNVQYTMDESRPAGDRIASITIDGQPLDPAATYTVGSVSFLLEGGDGFTAFTEGGASTDTGRIDREAFQDHLGSLDAPLEPAFDRRAVNVTGSTTEGGTTTLELSELNMTSLGAVANETVEIRKGSPEGEVVASAEVTGEPAKDASGQVGGAASLEVQVADLEGAPAYLVVSPAGTTMQLPAELFVAGDPEPTPEPTDRPTFGHGRDLADQRKADRGRPSGDLREWVLEQRERRSGR